MATYTPNLRDVVVLFGAFLTTNLSTNSIYNNDNTTHSENFTKTNSVSGTLNHHSTNHTRNTRGEFFCLLHTFRI